jgi:hypothetical protein
MTQIDVPAHGPVSSTRPWGWVVPLLTWLAAAVLLAASVAVQIAGLQVIAFAFASCGTLDVGAKHTGQLAVAGLCAAVAVIWLGAALVPRLRTAAVVAGLISTVVGLVIVVIALQPWLWTDGYCGF